MPRLHLLLDPCLLQRLPRISTELRPVERRAEMRMPEDEVFVPPAKARVPLFLERFDSDRCRDPDLLWPKPEVVPGRAQ
jgi:hypothetical protein